MAKKYCLNLKHYEGLPPCIINVSQCNKCKTEAMKKRRKRIGEKKWLEQRKIYNEKYEFSDKGMIHRMVKEGWIKDEITPDFIKVRVLQAKIRRVVREKVKEQKKQEKKTHPQTKMKI